MYKEIDGDLIELAIACEFDVIAHGCNCHCAMNSGIAVEMKRHFHCDEFPLENFETSGNINKLGQIDYQLKYIKPVKFPEYKYPLIVVNAYTQYRWDRFAKPIDYEALTLCMRKMNHVFGGNHIGLPKIGAGLAGGDWEVIKQIIQKELKDCDVTVVIYNK
jgi:O-acetyl-ADP-ribose deacetylase (regulator of RNase III)